MPHVWLPVIECKINLLESIIAGIGPLCQHNIGFYEDYFNNSWTAMGVLWIWKVIGNEHFSEYVTIMLSYLF